MGIFDTISGWIETPFDWSVKEVEDLGTWSINQIAKAADISKSDINKVGNDVAHFGGKILSGTVKLIDRLINQVHHELTILNSRVSEGITIAGAAAKWVSQAENWLKTRITSALSAFYNDDVRPLVSKIDGLEHHAADLVTQSLTRIGGTITNLITTYINPLQVAVQNLAASAQKALQGSIDGIYNTIVKWSMDTFGHVFDEVNNITNFMIQHVEGTVKIVEAAGSWLEQFALHPVTDIETMVREIFSADAIAKVEASAASEIANTDQLERFLGSLFKD